MRQHTIVQRDAAGRKPFGLRLVLAVNQPHEFAHDVHVVPRRTERMFGDLPTRPERSRIDIGCAFRPEGAVSTEKIEGSG